MVYLLFVKEISHLETHTGFWLRYVSNHVSHAFARKLEQTGVTVAEWVILRHLYDHTSTASSTLADLTGLTRGAVSKLIDRLVQKKLATREYREDDRRFQSLALTAAGRKLVPTLAKIADENDKAFFAPLSVAEHKALLNALKKLVAAHELKTVPTE